MIKISKEDFIKICNESLTMADAARKMNIHYNTLIKWAKKYGCYNPNQGGKGTNKPSHKETNITLDSILTGHHPEYQTFKLKNRLFKAGIKENKCECCGISEWNGKPLNMELHHIDGDRTNHKLDNLQILCPNCHSQTATFRAKNIKQ